MEERASKWEIERERDPALEEAVGGVFPDH